jgi:GH35 family endo-1,4-beta-xylanase
MRFRSFFRIACPLVAFVALASTPHTLREAASGSGALIGTAVRPYLLSGPAYSATLAHEFNMVEPEDALKWWTIRPTAESSWIGFHSHGTQGAGLLFDRGYKPKPAYDAMLKELAAGRR